MAIVEMKKVSLLALKKDKQKLLRRMQRLGCVEIAPHPELEAGTGADEAAEKRYQALCKRIARLDQAIRRLAPYDKHKPGLLDGRPEPDGAQVTEVLSARGDTFAICERVEAIDRRFAELRARETRDKAQIEQYMPWLALDLPLEKLGDTKHATVMLLTVPLKIWPTFEAGAAALQTTACQLISQGRDGMNALLARHKADAEAVDALIRDTGATRVNFDGAVGTPAQAIAELTAHQAQIDATRAELQAELDKLAESLPALRLLRDVEATERDREHSAGRCLDTASAFFMTGWAPAKRETEIREALRKISPTCEVDFEAPAPDDKPPTYMRNNAFVTPFESIVKMFAMPDPNGIDPTFVMMPFWVCFFGMMVSDAGYGVVMAIAATFVWWKLKGKGLGQMAFILAIGGLSTIVWGAIYGGWFGVTVEAKLLSPMDDSISVLILCVAFGALHLLTGLGVAAYMNFKRGKPLDALFDQGFWVFLLAGLGLMLVNGTIGGALALIGAAGIVFTAGRSKPGNLFKKLIGGFGALYGVTGYLSDLLSYARLFGMGLATGVIGMVVNMLASLLMGTWYGWIFAIVILVGLHAFNLFINALGAYVHSCRLQYIEFFGKFYESGGRDFRPLRNDTRYVELTDADA